MSFLGTIGVFSFGMPAYFLYQALLPRAGLRFGYLLLALALLAGILVVAYESNAIPYLGNRSNLWGMVFLLLILSQCLRPFWLISNRIFAELGKLSYDIYLCHPAVIYFLRPLYAKIYLLNLNKGLCFMLCCLLSIAAVVTIARCVHLVVERPGMRLGEWVISRRMARDNRARPEAMAGVRPDAWA